MRSFVASVVTSVLLAGLAACPPRSQPQEPAPPPSPPPIDAAPAPIDPGPAQTPQASTAIRASSYAQHCTRDEDCVAVFEGNACQPCRCAFNAIRTDALAKYKADLAAFWSCHEPEECTASCIDVVGDAAKCDAGTCILPPTP